MCLYFQNNFYMEPTLELLCKPIRATLLYMELVLPSYLFPILLMTLASRLVESSRLEESKMIAIHGARNFLNILVCTLFSNPSTYF